MSLKQIPESDKSIWRQLFQNARGRGDLKQPAGFLTLLTLLLVAYRGTAVSDALVLTLGGVVALWWTGDTTEAVAVLMALYGKWRTPDTQILSDQTQVDSQATTVTPSANANADLTGQD